MLCAYGCVWCVCLCMSWVSACGVYVDMCMDVSVCGICCVYGCECVCMDVCMDVSVCRVCVEVGAGVCCSLSLGVRVCAPCLCLSTFFFSATIRCSSLDPDVPSPGQNQQLLRGALGPPPEEETLGPRCGAWVGRCHRGSTLSLQSD